MLPAEREVRIAPLSPSSQDAQNHDESLHTSLQPWNGTLHDKTQISRRVALPPRSEANKYTQHAQGKHEKKLTMLRDQLRAYVTSCNDSKITEYEPFLVKIWRLFLDLKAKNQDITQNVQMYELLQKVVGLTERHNFDTESTSVIAAHYAFILHDKGSVFDKTIPFDFLRNLLNEHGVVDLDVHDLVAYVEQYDKTTDLSYSFDALRIHEDNAKIFVILNDVRKLQLHEYLFQFCSGKYMTFHELQTVWNNLMHAYDAYITYNHNPSLAHFAKNFSDGSEEYILKAGGKKVEEQTVRTILSNKTLPEAVEMINLPLLLLARKLKIRRKNIGPYVLKAFPMQQKQEALNSVLKGLDATDTHTQDAAGRLLKLKLYDTETKLRSHIDALCQGHVQIKALDSLSKEVDALLQRGVHPTTSQAWPESLGIRNIFNLTRKQGRKKAVRQQKGKQQISADPDSQANTTNNNKNETEEKNTKNELLQLIHKFCTLEETTDSTLEDLWLHIREKKKKLHLLGHIVGVLFVSEYGDSWGNSDQINEFCNANTFEEAVQWIKPRQLAGQTKHESMSTGFHENAKNKENDKLLELIRQFCTLKQTSVSVLKTLWVQINKRTDDNKPIYFEVGDLFVQKYDKFPVSSEEIRRFCVAPTFEKALGCIRLNKLVNTATLRPTKNQSTLLAEAYKCQLQLDEVRLLYRHFHEEGVDAASEGYAVVQKTASTLEAELDKALGQLREEREVLPRLLEELH